MHSQVFQYSTFSHGWNTSVLRVGWQVVPCDDVRVGVRTTPAGTRCVVVSDLADVDSAYAWRKVTVQVTEGQLEGTIHNIERSLLRVR
jgi:hypothetical protein